jgi:hypothetical protein
MNTPHLQAAGTAARQAARELETGAVEGVMAAGEAARDWWQRRADQTYDAAHAIRQEALALGDSTQRYVRDEPLKALLWAALAGAVVTGAAMLSLRRGQ